MIISSDFPIPKQGRGRPSKYPFHDMRKGESFAVSNEDVQRVARAASAHGRAHKKKFTIRNIDGDYRCWRLL